MIPHLSELLAICATCVTVVTVLKLSFDYRIASLKARRSPDNSMGKNELRSLIQEAIEQSTAPLHRRMAELEARLPDASLQELAAHEEASQRLLPDGAEPGVLLRS